MKRCLLCVGVLGCLLMLVGTATADPIISDEDLILYYDFEEDWQTAGVLSDKSADADVLDGEVVGRVFRTEDSRRGTGAALFDSAGRYLPDVGADITDPTDPLYQDQTWFPNDYFQLGSLDPLQGPPVPDAWGPAFTVSVWVSAKRYGTGLCDPSCASGTDMSLFGIRSATGAWVSHFQLQNSGNLRGQLRDDAGDDIATPNIAPFGNPWPEEVWLDGDPDDRNWFMYSQTYDSNGTFGGEPGHWVQYLDGVKFNEGAAVSPLVPGGAGNADLGGWGLAFNIGRDMDNDRQFHGFMDEYYVFTRALSETEVKQLYDEVYPLGDVNHDQFVNGLDVAPFVAKVISGEYQLQADTNEDGAVNGLDVQSFVDLVISGGVTIVPEPSTLVLAGLGVLGLGWFGRRRR